MKHDGVGVDTSTEGGIPCIVNKLARNATATASLIAGDARFRVHECTPDDLPDTVRSILDGGAGRIAVAGGDGTIAAAAALMVDRDAELAVVPGGTLNHFARRLGIPGNVRRALDVAAAGPSRPVDVGYVNDTLFLNSSSLGAYVDFVYNRERMENWSGYYLASVFSLFPVLGRLRLYTVDVESEGRKQRFRTPLVFMGVDERALVFPDLGDPIPDGRSGIHTLILNGETRTRVVSVALHVMARGLRSVSRTPHLESFIADTCTIELPQARHHVAIDGETKRLSTPLRYRIARDELRVVFPADGPE